MISRRLLLLAAIAAPVAAAADERVALDGVWTGEMVGPHASRVVVEIAPDQTGRAAPEGAARGAGVAVRVTSSKLSRIVIASAGTEWRFEGRATDASTLVGMVQIGARKYLLTLTRKPQEAH